MFDWNKPFTTRHKKPARLEHVLSKPSEFGETHLVEVDGEFLLYFPDGRFHSPHEESGDVPMDLVNIPEKKVVERWVVVTYDGSAVPFSFESDAHDLISRCKRLGVESRIHHIREEF